MYNNYGRVVDILQPLRPITEVSAQVTRSEKMFRVTNSRKHDIKYKKPITWLKGLSFVV